MNKSDARRAFGISAHSVRQGFAMNKEDTLLMLDRRERSDKQTDADRAEAAAAWEEASDPSPDKGQTLKAKDGSGERVAKRFYSKSITHIYADYLQRPRVVDGSVHALGFTKFCEARPYYCRAQSKSNARTCLCLTCENARLLVEAYNRFQRANPCSCNICAAKCACSCACCACCVGSYCSRWCLQRGQARNVDGGGVGAADDDVRFAGKAAGREPRRAADCRAAVLLAPRVQGVPAARVGTLLSERVENGPAGEVDGVGEGGGAAR